MENRLLLGVCRKDITPKIGGRLYGYRPDLYSESVNDSLTASAFAFTSGQEKFLLVSACVCLMANEVTDDLRGRIARENGIPRENIIIAATHTHSGPALSGNPGWGDIDWEYYNEILAPQITAAAAEAFAAQEPVRMGAARGLSRVGINRRQLQLDNSIALGQCEWGPFNPGMTVISFKNDAGKNVGTIVHYGCHGTCCGANVEISRDWSGVMTDALECICGGVAVFFNGAEGDVGPRLSNGKTVGGLKYIYETGAMGAEDAIRIFQKIDGYSDVTASGVCRTLQFPLNRRISYEAALAGCDKFPLDSINSAKQQAEYYNDVRISYENGYEEQPFTTTEQAIIRIGNFAFVSFPYELFSVIAMRIAEAVSDLDVLSLSNSNGSQGYFPTEDQVCRGGYEITMFKYKNVQAPPDNADFFLLHESLKNIEDLPR